MIAGAQPTCWIIAGPNGAGKTTFALDYLPKVARCEVFVNADLIAAGMSPLAPERERIAASRIFLREIERHVAARRDFGFETTLAGRGYLRLIRRLKSGGAPITPPTAGAAAAISRPWPPRTWARGGASARRPMTGPMSTPTSARARSTPCPWASTTGGTTCRGRPGIWWRRSRRRRRSCRRGSDGTCWRFCRGRQVSLSAPTPAARAAILEDGAVGWPGG